jgi:hypothetical protein
MDPSLAVSPRLVALLAAWAATCLLLEESHMLLPEALSGPVLAYVDPASGSLIFQALIGGAMAVGLTAKIYWRRIRRFFTRRTR